MYCFYSSKFQNQNGYLPETSLVHDYKTMMLNSHALVKRGRAKEFISDI